MVFFFFSFERITQSFEGWYTKRERYDTENVRLSYNICYFFFRRARRYLCLGPTLKHTNRILSGESKRKHPVVIIITYRRMESNRKNINARLSEQISGMREYTRVIYQQSAGLEPFETRFFFRARPPRYLEPESQNMNRGPLYFED